MLDIDKSLVKADAKKSILTWLGQAKPTEWITALVSFMTATATIGGLYLAYRSGFIDSIRADISARNERLTVEKLLLEQRKEQLTKDIEISRGELNEVKARLTPLQREKAAMMRIMEIRKNDSITGTDGFKHLSVGFSFNYTLDGYILTADSYTTVPVESEPGKPANGYNYSYDSYVKHPRLTDLLAAAEDLEGVTDMKLGRLWIGDEDIRHINGLHRLNSLECINSRLLPQTFSMLKFGAGRNPHRA